MANKLDKWYVFNGLVYCGILTYNEKDKTFSFKVENECARARGVIRDLNLDKDEAWCRETIFDRVFPPNRVNARELLRKIGLIEHDAWEIIKYVHLVTSDDQVWMDKVKDPSGWYKYHPFSELIPKEIASDPNIFV